MKTEKFDLDEAAIQASMAEGIPADNQADKYSEEYFQVQHQLEGIQLAAERIAGLISDDGFIKSRLQMLAKIHDRLTSLAERVDR